MPASTEHKLSRGISVWVWLAGIAATAVIAAAMYVGLYFALLEIHSVTVVPISFTGRVGPKYMRAEYPAISQPWQPFCRAAFTPLERCDRLLRPDKWRAK